ncbi:MAG TPA: histidinol-phosphate transaminase [Patescibacteria group bacterium]|nr:histidinol-phosphate transaminase [Patescibacteria group bacterium]
MSLVVPLRRAAQRMAPYHPPLEGRVGMLRLDFNENTVGPAPVVMQALASLEPERIASYPEYRAAEERLARFFGVRIENLIVTNGVDDALRLIADGFAEAGESALIVEPTYAMYRFYAELLGARVIALRYDDRMRFPLEDVLRALRRSRPRILFLANPNNPTGGLLGPGQLRKILAAARRTMVVVDEAYADFSGVSVRSWVSRQPNLIVVRTFSKAAGMAGLRIGCLLSNADVVTALRRVHSPYPVNSAALAAVLAVIRNGGPIRRYAREVVAARRELERVLRRLGVPFYPSAANFLLVDFGPRAPELLARLRRRGILLRDRSGDFGRVGWVRITAGPRAHTRTLIGALEELWKPGRS